MSDSMAVRILNIPQLVPAGLPKRVQAASTKATNQVGFVKRVQSSSGVYCIRVPNAAGAYRNSSGFNLAVATNCP